MKITFELCASVSVVFTVASRGRCVAAQNNVCDASNVTSSVIGGDWVHLSLRVFLSLPVNLIISCSSPLRFPLGKK